MKYQVRRFSTEQETDLRPDARSESAVFVIDNVLAYQIVTTARLLDRALSERLRRRGIAIGEWPVLMFLFADEGLSQSELSRLMVVEQATVTRTIDRMERRGLVKRVPHPTDGRRYGIYLTAKAKALRDKLMPYAVEVNGAAGSALGGANAKKVRQQLRAVQKALLELLENSPERG